MNFSSPFPRRSFLKNSSLALGGMAAASSLAATYASASSPIKDVIEWKLVMTWPKELPGVGKGAVRLAQRIEALSEGRMRIKVFGSGELIPAPEVFDAVGQGTVHMGHSAAYYWLSKHSCTPFFGAVPGGLTYQEHNGWMYCGGGQQLWDELYGSFGLKPFMAGNTGTQMGGWFRKQLHTLDDLKGLRMRAPGLGGEVFNRLGATAQTIPGTELFIALQSGIIDGLEWIGPWNDMSLGFHTVANYYYGPAFQEGGTAFELIVNKKAYEALPKDLQLIIRVACAAENDAMTAEYHANNLQAFHLLRHRHNVSILSYPDSILKAFFTTSRDVVRESAEKGGDIGGRIYASWNNYRNLCLNEGPYTEWGFLRGRMMGEDA